VIARDGTIAYAYTSLDPAKHVENTLAAVRALEKK
jgi:peroxiredoxin